MPRVFHVAVISANRDIERTAMYLNATKEFTSDFLG